ncbi:endolytic transglycosylase MltG [Rhodococcus sp. P1Y]|uniref:endolytic transglycosylase MltG n=1 Tax=Rhodococcus sp. P1Y TaxID=1302308 RepID=UPI000EAB6FC3|nr:endolytic transglycosylase MltG [Rhodococcus sp. P1Y]AYJ49631.1 endolytic transglycosylase MltG [Rhodococcus sp. P1Y]
MNNRQYEDEAHTDPIGYRTDEGSEFHRAVHRSEPQEVGRSRAHSRRQRVASTRKKRGRFVGLVLGLVVVLAIAGGGYFVYDKFTGGPAAPDDFAAGAAGDSVVVRVNPGDTAQQIGVEAADKGVVASSGAFLEAAIANSAIASVQPGYYLLPSNVPAAQAVTALVEPGARVGSVVISEGRQLHDARDVNTDAVKKGIYTLLSEASCIDISGSGTPTCISYDDFNAAGGVGDPSDLGVPDWAIEQVRGVPDRDRQLEGLIAAGSWDIDPTATAGDILRQLVADSAATYESTGILTAGANSGLDPYQTLVAASLVERESLPADFSKVARVIVNRLAEPQKLEFDSTVNYSLDTTEVATTDADRAAVTPWNTYAMEGLPATPIASPSVGAVEAVEAPADGDWLYFVTINQAGETLFTRDYNEHLANIGRVEDGFLESGR